VRIANREEIATFTFLGVTERIIIGEDEKLGWCMYYLRANASVQATIIEHDQSREELLERVKGFMIGHGNQGLMYNLIQSSEIFLPSTAAMNQRWPR
jgi:hypothetical protein